MDAREASANKGNLQSWKQVNNTTTVIRARKQRIGVRQKMILRKRPI